MTWQDSRARQGSWDQSPHSSQGKTCLASVQQPPNYKFLKLCLISKLQVKLACGAFAQGCKGSLWLRQLAPNLASVQLSTTFSFVYFLHTVLHLPYSFDNTSWKFLQVHCYSSNSFFSLQFVFIVVKYT